MRRLLISGVTALALAVPAPAAVIHGTDGPDILYGTPDADVIFGHKGADIIYGFAGDDVIRPGQGANRVYAGAGDDLIISRTRTHREERIRCGLGFDVQRDFGTALTWLFGCEASW